MTNLSDLDLSIQEAEELFAATGFCHHILSGPIIATNTKEDQHTQEEANSQPEEINRAEPKTEDTSFDPGMQEQPRSHVKDGLVRKEVSNRSDHGAKNTNIHATNQQHDLWRGTG